MAEVRNLAIESELQAKIEAWTSHMPWRADLADWKQRRLWQEEYQEAKLAQFLRYAGDLSGRRVLDLGCGMGGLAVALSRAGAIVTALDPNPDYCEITRLRAARYGLDLTMVNSAGESLPLNDGSFDIVVCYDVLEHAESPDDLLKEINRVLTPDGKAFLTITNRWVLKDPHYQLRFVNWMPRHLGDQYIARRGRSKAGSAFEDRQSLSDMHYFTLGQFRTLAGRWGFSAEEMRKESSAAGSVVQPVLKVCRRAGRWATTGAFHVFLQKVG
jgi:2-polyprenyl-3-methyl-5-hydroxy-6-metoxy-1,4-benzoquinol methylase